MQIQTLPPPSPATSNRSNEPLQNWQTLATVWAAIDTLNGQELWYAQQVSPDATVKVVIRRYAGLSNKHRFLLDGSRALNIRSIRDAEERHIEMVCYCQEAAA